MPEDRHIAIRSALGWAALCLLLGASSCAAPPTPEQPDPLYYFLDLEGPGPDAGAMDPRLQQLSGAFGAGDFPLVRQLAQSLLDDPDLSPDLRSEAAAYLIESYLAQGDFDATRDAVQRLRPIAPDTCQNLLAKTNQSQRRYEAEVTRFQHIVATTNSPAEAAQAQLQTAHLHEAFGRLGLAEQSYRKVVDHYPLSPEAGPAFCRLATSQWERGDGDGAIAACDWAIDAAPDHALGARACGLLATRFAQPKGRSYESARQRLSAIAVRHPATRTADAARFGIGRLYLIEGLPELAEREWAELVLERAGRLDASLEHEIAVRLAHVRYEQALAANSSGDRLASVEKMALVVRGSAWDRGMKGPLSLYALWCEDLAESESPRWYQEVLWAYQSLVQMDSRPDERLIYRAHLGLSLHALGRYEEAASELEAVLSQEWEDEDLRQRCLDALAQISAAHEETTRLPILPASTRPRDASRLETTRIGEHR